MKKLILLILLILLTSPVVSAFEFDNRKTFEKGNLEYGKVTITNAFGLGSDLAEIILTNNSDSCSEKCYAEGTTRLYYDGRLIDGLRFKVKEKGWNYANIKDYDIYLENGINEIEVNDYKTTCNLKSYPNSTIYPDCIRTKTGSHYEYKTNWQKYNGEILRAGFYKWRIEGSKEYYETVDWLGNWQGLEVNEWALWTGNQGPFVYWKFNESTGTIVGDATSKPKTDGLTNGTVNADWIPGLINNALNLSEVGNSRNISNNTLLDNPTQDFSIQIWFKPSIDFVAGIPDQYIFSKDNVPVQDRVSCRLDNTLGDIKCFGEGNNAGTWDLDSTKTSWSKDSWHHLVLVWDDSGGDVFMYIDSILNDSAAYTDQLLAGTESNFMVGTNTATAESLNGSVDEFGIWNRSLSATEVKDLYNLGQGLSFGAEITIILNSPVDNFNTTLTLNTFNVSANSTNNKAITNFSLFIDGDLNDTNLVSGTSNTTTFNKSLAFGTSAWLVQACNNESLCINSSTRTININPLTVNNQSFNPNTIEFSTESFFINFTTQGLQVSEVNLIYNVTENPSTFSFSGLTYIVDKSIVIPNVTVKTNNEFFWNIILQDGTEFNTSAQVQTVSPFQIDDCSQNKTVILNLTLVNEETQEFLNGVSENTSLELELSIFSLTSDVAIINFSNFYNETNPAGVCVNSLNESVFRMDVTMQYESTDKATEFYHIQKATLSNDTIPQEITLFDLDLVDSQEFLITFKDNTFLPVEDALINIDRKYISEGIFKTVEIPKTDEEGQTIAHLVLSDVVYTMIVSKNGEVLHIEDKVTVICENVAAGDCTINLNAFDTGEPTQNFSEVGGIAILDFSLDKSTREVNVLFRTLDGTVKTVELNTTKYDRLQNQTLCTDSLTSSTGTLTCTIPTSFGNITIVSELFSEGKLVRTKVFTLQEDPSTRLGRNGIIMGIMAIITMALLFSAHPIALVIGTFLGVVIAMALVIINTNSILGPASAILWLAIVIVIVIWRMSQKETT